MIDHHFKHKRRLIARICCHHKELLLQQLDISLVLKTLCGALSSSCSYFSQLDAVSFQVLISNLHKFAWICINKFVQEASAISRKRWYISSGIYKLSIYFFYLVYSIAKVTPGDNFFNFFTNVELLMVFILDAPDIRYHALNLISGTMHWMFGTMHQICGTMHRISGTMHRISSTMHQICGIMHQICGIVHRISGIMLQISGAMHQLFGIMHQKSSTMHQISGIMHQISSIMHQISSIMHRISSIMHRISGTMYRISGIMHWISFNRCLFSRSRTSTKSTFSSSKSPGSRWGSSSPWRRSTTDTSEGASRPSINWLSHSKGFFIYRLWYHSLGIWSTRNHSVNQGSNWQGVGSWTPPPQPSNPTFFVKKWTPTDKITW